MRETSNRAVAARHRIKDTCIPLQRAKGWMMHILLLMARQDSGWHLWQCEIYSLLFSFDYSLWHLETPGVGGERKMNRKKMLLSEKKKYHYPSIERGCPPLITFSLSFSHLLSLSLSFPFSLFRSLLLQLHFSRAFRIKWEINGKGFPFSCPFYVTISGRIELYTAVDLFLINQ